MYRKVLFSSKFSPKPNRQGNANHRKNLEGPYQNPDKNTPLDDGAVFIFALSRYIWVLMLVKWLQYCMPLWKAGSLSIRSSSSCLSVYLSVGLSELPGGTCPFRGHTDNIWGYVLHVGVKLSMCPLVNKTGGTVPNDMPQYWIEYDTGPLRSQKLPWMGIANGKKYLNVALMFVYKQTLPL